jgi:hypothetical protein
MCGERFRGGWASLGTSPSVPYTGVSSAKNTMTWHQKQYILGSFALALVGYVVFVVGDLLWWLIGLLLHL